MKKGSLVFLIMILSTQVFAQIISVGGKEYSIYAPDPQGDERVAIFFGSLFCQTAKGIDHGRVLSVKKVNLNTPMVMIHEGRKPVTYSPEDLWNSGYEPMDTAIDEVICGDGKTRTAEKQ